MEKAKERQQELFFCFIDYTKAFDCVDHNILWNGLRYLRIPEHLIVLIKNLYDNQQVTVCTDFGETELFSIRKEVRQGCILSPYLFNLYIEIIIRNAGLDEMNIGFKIGGRLVNYVRFADDTTLICTAKNDLEVLLNAVRQNSERFGLLLNLRKTKVMTTGCMDEFIFVGEAIEQVVNFILLGSNVNRMADCGPEIQRRMILGRTAMRNLTKIWKCRDITLTSKIRKSCTNFGLSSYHVWL